MVVILVNNDYGIHQRMYRMMIRLILIKCQFTKFLLKDQSINFSLTSPSGSGGLDEGLRL